MLDVLYLLHGEGHGGDAKATVRLAAAMQKSGFNVAAMISESQIHADAFKNYANEAGVPFHFLATSRSTSRMARVRDYAAQVGSKCPKVVHFHTGDSFVHVETALAIRLAHAGKRLATLHYYREKSTSNPKRLLTQWLGDRIFHKITVPSEYSRQMCLAHTWRPDRNKFIAIANLVDWQRLQNADRVSARRKLGLPIESPLILFASRFSKGKRPQDAIIAFQQISQRHSKAVLVMAGVGELLNECRSLAASSGGRIHFVGYRDDMCDLMAAADIHVLPSTGESFGLSVVEAMGAGAVNVVYDVPAVSAIVGNTGLICSRQHPTEIAAALDTLLSDPNLLVKLRNLGTRKAKREFAEHPLQQFLALYSLPRTSNLDFAHPAKLAAVNTQDKLPKMTHSR